MGISKIEHNVAIAKKSILSDADVSLRGCVHLPLDPSGIRHEFHAISWREMRNAPVRHSVSCSKRTLLSNGADRINGHFKIGHRDDIEASSSLAPARARLIAACHFAQLQQKEGEGEEVVADL